MRPGCSMANSGRGFLLHLHCITLPYQDHSWFDKECPGGSEKLLSTQTVQHQVLPPVLSYYGTHVTRVRLQITRWGLYITLDQLSKCAAWKQLLLGAGIHAERRNETRLLYTQIDTQNYTRGGLSSAQSLVVVEGVLSWVRSQLPTHLVWVFC